MSTRMHLKQLQDLKQAMPRRPIPPDGGLGIVTADLLEWPPDAVAAYTGADAADDREGMYQVIEEQTGTRVTRTPPAFIIEVTCSPSPTLVELVGPDGRS